MLINTSNVKIMTSELATTFILSGLRLEDDISLVIAVCVDPDPEIDSNPLRFIKFPYMAKPDGPEKTAINLFITMPLITLISVLNVVRVKRDENFNFLPYF